MSIRDELNQLKTELVRTSDAIREAQRTLDELKARRDSLIADRDEKKEFLDWKAAQP